MVALRAPWWGSFTVMQTETHNHYLSPNALLAQARRGSLEGRSGYPGSHGTDALEKGVGRPFRGHPDAIVGQTRPARR